MENSSPNNQPAQSLSIILHEGSFSIAKLPVTTDFSEWKPPRGYGAGFYSVSFCADEISIVCEEHLPIRNWPGNSAKIEPGWALLQVYGQLEFEMVGVIAKFSELFASRGIPIFCLSTFNTDYFLVKKSRVQEALAALEQNKIPWFKANA